MADNPTWVAPPIDFNDSKGDTDALLQSARGLLNRRAFRDDFQPFFNPSFLFLSCWKGRNIRLPSPTSPRDKFFFTVDKSDVGRTVFVEYEWME